MASQNVGRLTWTHEMHGAIIEGLVDQLHKGKRSDSGFKTEAYTVVTAQVKTLSDQPALITKDKVKNKVFYLKEMYEIYKLLEELSGMDKDPETGKLVAEDEVWDIYIVAHPGHKSRVKWLRENAMPRPELCSELWDKVTAKGTYAQEPPPIAFTVEDLADDDIDPTLRSITPSTQTTSSKPTPTPEVAEAAERRETAEKRIHKRKQIGGGGEQLATTIKDYIEEMKEARLQKTPTQIAIKALLERYRDCSATNVLKDADNAELWLGANNDMKKQLLEVWVGLHY